VSSYKRKKGTGIQLQIIRTVKMGQKGREIDITITLIKSQEIKKGK